MTLGNLLSNISVTEGLTQEQLKAEFLERIRDHREENLLKACYKAACCGRNYIILGKNVLPPQCLEKEGFILQRCEIGTRYYFE